MGYVFSSDRHDHFLVTLEATSLNVLDFVYLCPSRDVHLYLARSLDLNGSCHLHVNLVLLSPFQFLGRLLQLFVYFFHVLSSAVSLSFYRILSPTLPIIPSQLCIYIYIYIYTYIVCTCVYKYVCARACLCDCLLMCPRSLKHEFLSSPRSLKNTGDVSRERSTGPESNFRICSRIAQERKTASTTPPHSQKPSQRRLTLRSDSRCSTFFLV